MIRIASILSLVAGLSSLVSGQLPPPPVPGPGPMVSFDSYSGLYISKDKTNVEARSLIKYNSTAKGQTIRVDVYDESTGFWEGCIQGDGPNKFWSTPDVETGAYVEFIYTVPITSDYGWWLADDGYMYAYVTLRDTNGTLIAEQYVWLFCK